jgi:hypothetical protein
LIATAAAASVVAIAHIVIPISIACLEVLLLFIFHNVAYV